MSDLLSQRQFEEAGVNDDQAAVNAAILADRLNSHNSTVGIVESFDSEKQTAVVRPVVKRYFRNGGWKPLPKLLDVPVMFPRGGGFVLTFPVSKGDECVLWFADRAIDSWFSKGGVQEPTTFRSHDMSDAYASVGISSLPNKVEDFNGDAVELRRLDGAAKVQISGHDISVKSDSGTIEVASGSGTIKLNAPSGATHTINGVLNGSHPCPVIGMAHGMLGAPCARVLAGST